MKTNVEFDVKPADLRDAALWFEGLMKEFNTRAEEAGIDLVGWQTSNGYAWMEVLEKAIGGTIGCVISGVVLTAAVLLAVTADVQVAVSTMLGVVLVLVCFVGFLVQAGYTLGVIEAIAVTMFIGLACDYMAHVLQVTRAPRLSQRKASTPLMGSAAALPLPRTPAGESSHLPAAGALRAEALPGGAL